MRDPIKTTLFRRHGFLAGSVLAVALHGHALSQEAPDQRGGSLALMEEITVTAQKREENIQSVPISMQALTGNMIEKLDLKRANEVERLVPNLDARMAADTQINYSIRGVGENNFHTNSVGAVGLYLDEVTLSSPISTALQLFDMERIEVLRGPQNTLFGLNTTGGAVNFITRKPEVGGDPNGRVRATYGRFNQMDVEGAVGLPLGETAAIRVAGAVQSRNGWQRNLTRDEKAHEIERYAGRVQLAFEPGERLEILLNVHGALNRGDNRHYKSIGTQDPADPGQPCPLIGGPINVGDSCVDGGGFQDNDDFREYFGDMGPLRNDIDNYGAIASLQWHFDTFSLSSITAYISNELERHEDADASPNAFFGFHQFADVEQFSQEVRLTSTADADLRWIAGSIYFEEDSFYSTSVRRAPAGILPGAWPPGNFTIMPTTQVDQKNRNWSLYGQAEYDVTNDLKITGGLRWVRETKTGVNNAFVGSGGGLDPNLYIGPDEALINTPLQTLPPLAFDFTWKEWGGKLGVDYHVSDDLMVYASVARGFKGGGISVAALQALVGQAAREVRPETLLTYEAGFKATLDDKRLT
ncbi:MAG: TonB-dependent receptor, partial [Sphingomonadales bacterium]